MEETLAVLNSFVVSFDKATRDIERNRKIEQKKAQEALLDSRMKEKSTKKETQKNIFNTSMKKAQNTWKSLKKGEPSLMLDACCCFPSYCLEASGWSALICYSFPPSAGEYSQNYKSFKRNSDQKDLMKGLASEAALKRQNSKKL